MWLKYSVALLAQIFVSTWLKYSLTFTIDLSTYEFNQFSLSELVKEVNANSMRAELEYTDRYITMTGFLREYDSQKSENSFVIADYQSPTVPNTTAKCILSNKTLQEAIISAMVGDKLTIWGQITNSKLGTLEINVLGLEFEQIPDNIEDIDFKKVDFKQFTELSYNEANNQWGGEYIECTGVVSGIGTEGFAIREYLAVSNYGQIGCTFDDKTRLGELLELSTGDTVTIYGRVQQVDGAFQLNYSVRLLDYRRSN